MKGTRVSDNVTPLGHEYNSPYTDIPTAHSSGQSVCDTGVIASYRLHLELALRSGEPGLHRR